MSGFSEGLLAAVARRDARKAESTKGGLFLGEKLDVSIPVDSTSYIKVPLSCTLLVALGITDLPWDKIPNKKYATPGSGGTPVEGRRSVKRGQARGDNKRESNRRFRVKITTPVEFNWKSETRKCEWLSFRMPIVVSIAAIGYFLYEYSSTEARPSVWASEREVYDVIPIALADLGEMTNKSEFAEDDQVSKTDEQMKEEEPTKVRAPGS